MGRMFCVLFYWCNALRGRAGTVRRRLLLDNLMRLVHQCKIDLGVYRG